jgi:hypothetical protein
MSAIASLYNVPGSDEERAIWSSAHMAHHRDINRRLYEIAKIALPEYLLDPVDPNNIGPWADLHQAMHQQFDELLGISGYDLLGVDWTNQDLLASWIFLNADEHHQAADILGIG